MRRQHRPYVCGIDAAIDVVGGKWKVLILWALHGQVRPFAEVRDLVEGIPEKTLTLELREMEADGLVHRTVRGEVPPRVEYSLTPFGSSLNEALGPLSEWGKKHMKRIEAVRTH